MTADSPLAAADLDALALKPAETDLSALPEFDASLLVVDWEGNDHVPDGDVLAGLARERTVRLTVPVRADGYDPLGDDSLLRAIPDTVGRVVVGGHPAYLTDEEASRAVAPRLRAAAETATDPWVGSEGVERVAMAVGGVQYDLLSRTTAREARALRAAGFEGGLAVYAPTVFATDDDKILDAVGEYAARRPPVRRALSEEATTDADASGRDREVLLSACRDYALVGTPAEVGERVRELREAGMDRVVAYPAEGVAAVA
jgi:hypothetical protein